METLILLGIAAAPFGLSSLVAQLNKRPPTQVARWSLTAGSSEDGDQ